MIEPSIPPPEIDEADLHAWVDGRLPPARRPLLERHLAANPALRQRIEDWAAQSTALRQALRHDEDTARAALMARLAGPRRPRLRWAVAASLLLGASIGAAAGWTVHGDRRPSEISRLGVEAATALRMVEADIPAPTPVSAVSRSELRATLAQRLGRPIQVPDLSAIGYRLTGGRVVAAIYGPAALLTYADAQANRITVYLQPMQVGEPATMRPLQTDAMNGYAWIDRKIGYTVMSDEAKDRVHQVADRVRAEMGS